MKDGLISISQAAALLHRSTKTLRRWDRDGHTSEGLNFRAACRDTATGTRYYRKQRILEIRAAMFTPTDPAQLVG